MAIPSWLHLSKTSGGTKAPTQTTVTAQVDANTGSARSYKLTVKTSDNVTKYITVNQEGVPVAFGIQSAYVIVNSADGYRCYVHFTAPAPEDLYYSVSNIFDDLGDWDCDDDNFEFVVRQGQSSALFDIYSASQLQHFDGSGYDWETSVEGGSTLIHMIFVCEQSTETNNYDIEFYGEASANVDGGVKDLISSCNLNFYHMAGSSGSPYGIRGNFELNSAAIEDISFTICGLGTATAKKEGTKAQNINNMIDVREGDDAVSVAITPSSTNTNAVLYNPLQWNSADAPITKVLLYIETQFGFIGQFWYNL